MKKIYSRIKSLSLALVVLACVNGANTNVQAIDRPNVIIMMADDLGYADISCFGSERIKTPQLDKLAKEGVKLEACYAAHPTCSPSRSGMMTGRTPFRSGIFTYLPGNVTAHLQEDEISLGTFLKSQGYDTGFFGKWALIGQTSFKGQPTPKEHGFDYYLGSQNNAIPSHKNPTVFVRNGEQMGEMEGYSAQIVVDEAMKWIESRPDKSKPFCCIVWFHEPHLTLAQPQSFTDMYSRYSDMEAEYYGNVSHMDYQAGRLIDYVDKSGYRESTFVMFTSDNGPKAEGRPGRTGIYSGAKSSFLEGGIRMPSIIRWPGNFEGGGVDATPVSSLDLLPTFYEMLGKPLPTDRVIDGESFLPLVKGESWERSKPIVWFGKKQGTLLMGKWKLHGMYEDIQSYSGHMEYFKKRKLESYKLYDLESDPSESRNLFNDESKIAGKLVQQLKAISRSVQKDMPVWKGKFMANQQ